MKKSIGNFMLECWVPTPIEQSMMDGTLERFLNESIDANEEEVPSDFLEVQDFNAAMEEIKREIDEWQSE